MLKKLKVTSCAFIFCLFGFTLMTVFLFPPNVYAQSSGNNKHNDAQDNLMINNQRIATGDEIKRLNDLIDSMQGIAGDDNYDTSVNGNRDMIDKEKEKMRRLFNSVSDITKRILMLEKHHELKLEVDTTGCMIQPDGKGGLTKC